MPAKTCINYHQVLEGLELRGAVVRLVLIWMQIVLFLGPHSISLLVNIHPGLCL